MRKRVQLLFFFFLPIIAVAQNLTGTWEGSMGNEFLQINIIHTAKGICGYTYDFAYGNQRNYCRAYFDATWDAENNQLNLIGSSMIENSGTHALMRFHFVYSSNFNGAFLSGKEFPKYFQGDISKVASTSVSLRKISETPTLYTKDIFASCSKDTVKKDTIKIAPPLQPIVSKKDTTKSNAITRFIKPIIKPKTIETKMVERKKEVISTIKVNANLLTIKLYDNGTVDGDTVSVFHNGKLLVSHQLLSTKAVEVTIDINKENPRHEIVLFAENLGSIPPNTALLIIQAGNKRYELRASADLTKNASLIFEYDPTVQ
jgi:hypothetical protein